MEVNSAIFIYETGKWPECVCLGAKRRKMRKTFYSSVMVLPKEFLLRHLEKLNPCDLLFLCSSQR